MKTVSALVFRKKFGAILDEVAKGKEPIAVTRANRLLVVMAPPAVYEARTDQDERRKRMMEASRRIDEWAKRNAKHMKKGPDVVTLLRRDRESH